MDGGHEIEVVGTKRASDPVILVGPMAAFVAVFVDGDPVGMCIVNVLMTRVRVSTRDDIHAELAACGDDVAERVTIAEPLAAVMQRNFSGIERNAAARVNEGGVGVHLLEIVEPEIEAVVAG